MLYYLIVILAVVMFGGGFALNDSYRVLRSSSVESSLESGFFGALGGLVILLAIGDFRLEITPFTLLMAFLAALDGLAFVWFSFQALDRVNLSQFSLFSMLGGMLLPFFQGLLFFGEPITAAKVLCVVLVTAALWLGGSGGKAKGGGIYYAGVFVLNGLSGVLSKIFTTAPYPKASPEGYSVWIALFTALLSGLLWLLLYGKRRTPGFGWKALAISTANGVLNRVANFMLVLTLVHLDASVQSPLVTGGVMIVSTFICILQGTKPSRKELLSVAVAFLGMLALFLIKI